MTAETLAGTEVAVGQPLVRIEGVHKSFGALQVLRGIDLDINKGEVVVLLGLLIIVPLSGLDFLTGAFVLFSWVMVMAVELINSAIEATLNRFGPEIHPLTKRGKDIASAAVFCAVSFNIILWLALIYRWYKA